MSLWSCNECSQHCSTRHDLNIIGIEQDDDVPLRIGYARELPMYLRAVLAAGSFARYDVARRAPFVAMLERVGAFPLPRDMISVVCAFWLHVSEYNTHTNLFIGPHAIDATPGDYMY